MIKRTFPAVYRAESENGIIHGVPVVFNTPTDIGGWFEEEIQSGAIDQRILGDVAFYYNHDIHSSKPHARSRRSKEYLGGMDLTVSGEEVEMTANINRDRTDSNDLYLAIRDETIDGMSFMFRVKKERWERMDSVYPKRIIEEISEITEVSAVNYPAYTTTHVGVERSNESSDVDREALEKARKKENRKTVSPEIKGILLRYKN